MSRDADTDEAPMQLSITIEDNTSIECDITADKGNNRNQRQTVCVCCVTKTIYLNTYRLRIATFPCGYITICNL